nr:hypothetical protein [Tanacetum cinerariifolium]
MEYVFHISNYAAENQVKFATCTLHSVALTWWNTHVQTIGHEAAYGMMFSEEFDKVKKYVGGLPDMIHGSVVASKPKTMQEAIEIATELIDKKIRTFAERETTVGHEAAYNMSWKTLMKMMTDKYCPRNEIRKLEMEIWELKCKGLPDMIHGSVVASKPKTMQEAIKIATELMDKKIRTYVERETASKRKLENTSRTTRNQQQQQYSNKRQNTGRVYTATSGGKKQYGGSKPLCAKCNYHHGGPCAPKCHNCNKIGHLARDVGECPKLKNDNNHGNQGGSNNTPARVYAVGRAGTDPDANVETGGGAGDNTGEGGDIIGGGGGKGI